MGLANDALTLPGIYIEFAYWRVRAAEWRMSNVEILETIGFGVGALACIALTPSWRDSHFAVVPIVGIWLRASRLVQWLHEERWFFTVRLTVLGVVILYSLAALSISTPVVFGQNGRTQIENNARELANYGARIVAMEEWQKNRENQQLPARIMVLEQTTTRIVNELESNTRLNWATLAGITVFLLQQFFQLLMKNGKREQQ